MAEVILKPIEGYKGLYSVSNMGDIYRHPRLTIHGTGRRYGEGKAKPYKTKTGYFIATLKRDGKVERTGVHRLVAKAFIPNPEKRAEVNHKNGNKIDNRVVNLEWVTRQENSIHAHLNGWYGRGSLTPKDIQKIRQLRQQGKLLREIAPLFKVKEHTISRICTGVRWSFV